VRAARRFIGLWLLILTACASPREKAYRAATADYQRMNAAVVEFARANVKQLVAATKVFHSSTGRWPQTFAEFADFAFDNRVAVDVTAFNDLTFATLDDGSVQIHYDVNCSRFSDPQYHFTRTGSVNVTAR
jgi:hypothetical protein